MCKMNHPRSAKLRGQRGSALLEFALVSIVVLTVLFVIVDFSRMAFAYHCVSEVAREATRYAAVRGSSNSGGACPNGSPFVVTYNCIAGQDDINSYVRSLVPSSIYINSSATSTQAGYFNVGPTWLTNNAGCPGAQKQPGCAVQVTVSYVFGFDLPILKNYTTIPISSTSQMDISQ